MYLMYYTDEQGKRIYTLEVRLKPCLNVLACLAEGVSLDLPSHSCTRRGAPQYRLTHDRLV